eukprot:403363826
MSSLFYYLSKPDSLWYDMKQHYWYRRNLNLQAARLLQLNMHNRKQYLNSKYEPNNAVSLVQNIDQEVEVSNYMKLVSLHYVPVAKQHSYFTALGHNVSLKIALPIIYPLTTTVQGVNVGSRTCKSELNTLIFKFVVSLVKAQSNIPKGPVKNQQTIAGHKAPKSASVYLNGGTTMSFQGLFISQNQGVNVSVGSIVKKGQESVIAPSTQMQQFKGEQDPQFQVHQSKGIEQDVPIVYTKLPIIGHVQVIVQDNFLCV